MNKLHETLQEFQDFYEYGGCLETDLKKLYENYLSKKLKRKLNEVQSGAINSMFDYKVYKTKQPVIDRFENFCNGFKRIKVYDFKRSENGDKIPIPNYMTHLFNKEGKPCTKKEFEEELLEFEFDEQSLAQTLIKEFLTMFRGSGWLDLESLPNTY